MRGAAFLALACMLAACGERDAQPVATSSPEGTARGEGEPAQAAEDTFAIALDIGGLRLVDPASGRTAALSFGLPRKAVQDVVAKSTGLAAKTSHIGECPSGAMDFASFGALTLNFANGMFAGWALREGTPELTTMDGIGIGSTREEVEAARTIAMLEDSTLGAEFVMAPISDEQNLSGIFDGPGPRAKVENLWAGVACNFR